MWKQHWRWLIHFSHLSKSQEYFFAAWPLWNRWCACIKFELFWEQCSNDDGWCDCKHDRWSDGSLPCWSTIPYFLLPLRSGFIRCSKGERVPFCDKQSVIYVPHREGLDAGLFVPPRDIKMGTECLHSTDGYRESPDLSAVLLCLNH